MKKLITLTTLIVFLPCLLMAQTRVVKKSNITTALTGGDGAAATAVSIYFGFNGSGGTDGLSTTAFNPPDNVSNTGNLTVYGKISLTSGTEASDSLEVYALPLGHDGYVMGTDTLYFDWTNNTISLGSRPSGAARVKNFTLWSSPTLGSTAYTFDLEMTGFYPPCYGLKFSFDINDAGDGLYSLDFFIAETQ